MRLLLDTCTFLWAVREPEKLSSAAYGALADPDNQRFISVVTVWEVAQKAGRDKLGFSLPITEVFAKAERDLRLRCIPLDRAEALAIADLPLIHRDPFDRMLVCQAQVRGLTLVTPDEAIRQYEVLTLW
ncbi:type II toxin-antitoxin system VapC family toxin [bacterium]|nr:MAG: type II toxin-antitoxin system VapC family toxin [bacterium]